MFSCDMELGYEHQHKLVNAVSPLIIQLIQLIITFISQISLYASAKQANCDRREQQGAYLRQLINVHK